MTLISDLKDLPEVSNEEIKPYIGMDGWVIKFRSGIRYEASILGSTVDPQDPPIAISYLGTADIPVGLVPH